LPLPSPHPESLCCLPFQLYPPPLFCGACHARPAVTRSTDTPQPQSSADLLYRMRIAPLFVALLPHGLLQPTLPCTPTTTPHAHPTFHP
jgi:hypothetical protein